MIRGFLKAMKDDLEKADELRAYLLEFARLAQKNGYTKNRPDFSLWLPLCDARTDEQLENSQTVQ